MVPVGSFDMRAARVLAVILVLSVATGLVLGLLGLGSGRALLGGLGVLVALQVAYFAFLLVRARSVEPEADDADGR